MALARPASPGLAATFAAIFAATLAALSIWALASASTDGGGSADVSVDLRVVALVDESSRIEFGLRGADGETLLPELRFLNERLRRARVGRWLRSSPVDVLAATAAQPPRTARIEARVNAMPRADGSVAFAVEVGGERYEPELNILSTRQIEARANRWLRSTLITATETVDLDRLSPIAPEPAADSDSPAASEAPEPASGEPQHEQTTASGGDDAADDDEAASAPGESDAADESAADADGEEPAVALYRIPDGTRAGAVAQRNIIGDPDAPVLIRDVSDFL